MHQITAQISFSKEIIFSGGFWQQICHAEASLVFLPLEIRMTARWNDFTDEKHLSFESVDENKEEENQINWESCMKFLWSRIEEQGIVQFPIAIPNCWFDPFSFRFSFF